MGSQEEKLRKGAWIEEEDQKLIATVSILGERRWDALAKASGLRRSGKSCRLRWMNYLRPDLKHARITAEEEMIIFQLHSQWGNKWSKIAQKLPGRTDNVIKNYWRSQSRKKTQAQDHCSNEMPINNSDKNQNCDIEECMSVKCDIAGTSSQIICTGSSPAWAYDDCIYSESEDSLESRLCYPRFLLGSNDVILWDTPYSIWDNNAS